MSRKEEQNVSKRSRAKNKSMIAARRKSIGDQLHFDAAEAYKLLRTNLIFSMADESACKIIGISSALRGEGKTTTAINLAYTLAESGKRVLLIDGDMRLPAVASSLRIEDVPGLSNVLAGLTPLKETVRPGILLEAMSVLPAGEIPPNPAELLASPRMEQIITTLAANYEYIIMDLPPINAVTDALVVSKLLSGMIVVVRQDYGNQHALAEAMRRLELLEVKVLGFVMTNAKLSEKHYKKYGHKYSYGYGYGSRTSSAPSPAAAKPAAQELEFPSPASEIPSQESETEIQDESQHEPENPSQNEKDI